MSVTKFKSAFDMPAPPRAQDLARSMAAVWERAHLRGPPQIRRGVFKYLSIQDAQAAREEWTRQRIADLKNG